MALMISNSLGRRGSGRFSNLNRRLQLLIILLAATLASVLLAKLRLLAGMTSSALLFPPPVEHNLQHLRRERSLKRYLDSIQLLIEPSSSPCEDHQPLLVLVASGPANVWSRMAIRDSWAAHLTTVFVMGLDPAENDNQLSDIYLEAKQFNDMVVFDLVENYQNLTLKTGLLLDWSRRRCPQAKTLFKTDDDVLVNPWTMRRVVAEHAHRHLVGYRRNHTFVHRDEYVKWFMPRWLFPDEIIPEYLSGTGYIIQGDYVDKILKGAYNVPLINLEDIYFTYLVASDHLRLNLTHEQRISPFKPLVRTSCAFWGLAAAHSLDPDEMISAWTKISAVAEELERGNSVCTGYGVLSSDFFLY